VAAARSARANPIKQWHASASRRFNRARARRHQHKSHVRREESLDSAAK
jgi:hypothetical protein